jgi:formylmethanofuran dehydrogenase subunit C
VSGLTLTLTAPLAADTDLSALTADGWASSTAATVAARPVFVGRVRHIVGELFTISGEPGDTLALHGDLARAHGIGARLALGTLVVHGDVGNGTGIAMSGGLLHVHGNAGDNLGGAFPGEKRGMTGGELLVTGNAGDESGAAVRRGTIAIGGNAGARTCRGGIAGTVYVAGDCGADAGLFLKRASIIVGGRVAIPAGFREACTYDPAVVRLLQRRLLHLGFPLPAAQRGGSWRRCSGDAGDGALGELLLWTS